MNYSFNLSTPDGKSVPSQANYKDQESALSLGVAIAKRLVDLDNGTPHIREELRVLYPQDRIEVSVVDVSSRQAVRRETVTRSHEQV